MMLIALIVIAFPLGFFIRRRDIALISWIAVQSFLFSFQNLENLTEWVNGSFSGFSKDPHAFDWSYGLVNLLIYGAGFGLVLLGHRLSRGRRAKREVAGATAAPVDVSA
jgi:hypothetical protein